jgi:hypothetical protein
VETILDIEDELWYKRKTMKDFDSITWMKLRKKESPAKGGIYIARRLTNLEQPAWYLAVDDGRVPNGQRCFWNMEDFEETFEILAHSNDPKLAGEARICA